MNVACEWMSCGLLTLIVIDFLQKPSSFKLTLLEKGPIKFLWKTFKW